MSSPRAAVVDASASPPRKRSTELGTYAPRATTGRLRKRAEFVAAARGRRWSSPYFLLQSAPRPAGATGVGIGFTVTKRVGNAVIRNRVRRRLKEAVKQAATLALLGSRNLVIVARSAALSCPFAALVDKLEEGFQVELRRGPPRA